MRWDMDREEFDDVFELKKAAVHYGVIRQGGSYYYYTPPGRDEEIKIGQGEKACREFIAGDLTLQEEIRDKAMLSLQR
jgi:hypothetical protein